MQASDDFAEKYGRGQSVPPWVIIDANEGDKACLAIMLAVTERLEKALADRAKGKKAGVYKGPVPEKDQYKKGILSEVDLTKSLEKVTSSSQISAYDVLHLSIPKRRCVTMPLGQK